MGMRTKLETLTNQFSDSKQHIEVLKESLTAKEQRSTIIQTEVCCSVLTLLTGLYYHSEVCCSVLTLLTGLYCHSEVCCSVLTLLTGLYYHPDRGMLFSVNSTDRALLSSRQRCVVQC
jgi:hypothetical protein